MTNGRFHRKPPALVLAAALILFAGPFSAAADTDPATIRILANILQMSSLKGNVVPESPQVSTFVQDRAVAVRLGKALFWDMQVGSDGQACASCHFHAGADSRAKNQLQPGVNGGDSLSGNNPFTGFLDFPGFGPNYTLTAGDFPFHTLSNPANTNSTVLRDTNDVVSSQGVFKANFVGIDPLSMFDVGAPVPDPTFNVNGINTRRVEPRNTPTVINAAYNIANFWDGRANFYFNGVDPFGPLNMSSVVYENIGGVPTPATIRIALASLASQAVGPPLSENEMSFAGRAFPDVGRKLIARVPLAYQLVHPQDGILGPLSRATLNPDGTASGLPGLSSTYDNLVRTAFRPQYWNATQTIGGYTQMEANFSLFFGLAVQLYEETLQSDQAPYDRFMDGDDRALTAKQLRGFEVFLGKGGCAGCHKGPTLSDASLQVVGFGPPTLPVVPNNAVELMEMNDAQLSIYDGPFHNVGVRPSNPVGAAPPEDMGRGDAAPFLNPLTGLGFPLSYSRLAKLKAIGLLPTSVAALTPSLDPRLPVDIRAAADGEFKTPSLRNAELTGPYFHNGGQASLRQVVEFYDRGGDFLTLNDPDSDPLAPFIGFTPAEEEELIAFLLALTDPRVRLEKAPFDHPQILVPDGHPGNRNQLSCVDPAAPFQACDERRDVPAVGAQGRIAAGMGPLPTFLGIEQLPLDVGISESLRSPQPVGTPSVTFAAVPVGGSGSYEFRFLLDNVVAQGYSSAPSWTWATAGAAEGGYVVAVQARNAGSAAQFDAAHQIPYVIGKPPATGVTLSASPASPQRSGGLVVFDAAASGPSGSFEYRFLLAGPGGSPSVVRPYGAVAFWTWDTAGLADGTYEVTVQARTTGSTAAFEAAQTVPFALASQAPNGVTLSAGPASPAVSGTAVTFTASATGGGGSYEYQFLGRAAGSSAWSVAQAYGPASSWTWTSVAGIWEVMVNARAAGSSASSEAAASVAYVVNPAAATGVALSAGPASPATPGTAVTFTAAASGGSGSYEYQFLGRAAGSGAWSVAQAYGPASSWTWNSVAGSWEVMVNARSAGSTASAEATAMIPYDVQPAAPTGVTLSASPASPAAPGTSVTFTAAASGGTGPYEYQFLGRAAGSSVWSVAQAYGPASSWTWASVAGFWEVMVNARAAGSAAAAEATATIPFTVD